MKNLTTAKRPPFDALNLTLALMLALPCAAHADEREDLEKLRATVLGLVETLVVNGILPREQVDAMMKEAQTRANARLAQAPPSATTADGKKVVRVPYIPESVKTQMRDEIKTEVLAETKAAQQVAFASQSRLRFEGDLRVRDEIVRGNPSNTTTEVIQSKRSSGLTRAPDGAQDPGSGLQFNPYNTQDDYSRMRIRARLTAVADITDNFQAEFGIASGGTSGPTSTNVALGQGADKSGSYFNRYNVTLDRAAIQYKSDTGVSVFAGRFRNPFMKTELVWAEDLRMDGLVASATPAITPELSSFATVGWFPLSANRPDLSTNKSMLGVQGGIDWQIGVKENRLKLSAALYNFSGVEGVRESGTSNDSPNRWEYGSNYRQRGNTLFALTDSRNSTVSNPTWGLASSFNELDLNAQLNLVQFEPIHVQLNANFVKNIGFDRSEIKARLGSITPFTDGKDYGYLLRAQLGSPKFNNLGDWSISLGYRYLGSDAVLDAFTDSDFGLGGTNTKGFILAGGYGLAKNTTLRLKLMSATLIDSIVPTTGSSSYKSKLSSDVIHVDMVTSF